MAPLFGWVVGAEAGAASSGQTVEMVGPVSVNHPEEVEETLEDLSDQVRLWYDAVLTGSEDRAKDIEEDLLRAIRSDLEEMETTVREHATRVALSGSQSNVEGNAEPDADRQALQQTLSLLREKARKS